MGEPTHRRGQAVHDRVLDTTLRLLAERRDRFSVEDVAAEAGVHKTTVYRRWPTKALLIAAAVERLAVTEMSVRRTDDPVADLTDLALGVARTVRTPAGTGALRAILGAAGDDPELVPTAREFLTRRYAIALAIIDDAVAAGLLRSDVDPTVLWEAIVNPLHVRALLGRPADDDVVHQLVDLAVRGASTSP